MCIPPEVHGRLSLAYKASLKRETKLTWKRKTRLPDKVFQQLSIANRYMVNRGLRPLNWPKRDHQIIECLRVLIYSNGLD